jgi:hypothetical protein
MGVTLLKPDGVQQTYDGGWLASAGAGWEVVRGEKRGAARVKPASHLIPGPPFKTPFPRSALRPPPSSLAKTTTTPCPAGILVGADKARDLAVVQINTEPENLRPLPLARSGDLRVGQQVLAVGNPYGFEHSATTGAAHSL